MGVTVIISFFTVRVTLSVLGVSDYGLNNLVGSVVAMFSFINASMGTAVQRYYSIEIGKKNDSELSKVFGVGIFLHLIVAFVTLVFAEIFALFFLYKLNIPMPRMHAAQVVFQVSILSLVIEIISVPYTAFLRAKEEFSKMAVLEIMQSCLRLLVLYLLCVATFDKLITLSFLNFGVTIMYITSIIIVARRYKNTKFKIINDKKLEREMLGFISSLLFTVLASLFRDKGLVIMINIFFGLAINAAYAISSQVMAFINTFALNFKQSVVPQIMSAFGAGDKHRMMNLILSGTKFTFLLMLMITVPLGMESSFLLKIWLKDVPEYSIQFTCLLLINVNISSFAYFLDQGIQAVGKIKLQQLIMSSLYVLNVLAVYICFKVGLSFYWAIYISIFVSALQCIVNIAIAKVRISLNVLQFIKKIILRAVPLVLMSICIPYFIIYCFPPSLVRVVFVFLTSILVIGIGGYMFFLNDAEKTMLHGFISSSIRNR